jgi:hypothetical protein
VGLAAVGVAGLAIAVGASTGGGGGVTPTTHHH